MMLRNLLSRCRLLLWLCALCATATAQPAFQPGQLYHLTVPSLGLTVTLDAQGRLSLQQLAAADPGQHFTVSELSGSWRFINPFDGRAIRTEGQALEAGENNGSDEAQLWKTETVGQACLLIPTNRPDMAAAAQGNNLVLVAKTQAVKQKNAHFKIERAARAGFDVALTYRIRSVAQPEMVLGNGD